jgi:hypothetical protein
VAVSLASFRDPAGSVFSVGSRVFRSVSESSFPILREFLDSQTGQQFVASGRLVETREISHHEIDGGAEPHAYAARDSDTDANRLLEHHRIWFPSYAYEWPAEMLFAAGDLTMELAEQALTESFGMKDASPYNVLFQGPRPVFVDVLSFEKRDPRDPTWLPYAQFLRMFVFPLMMTKEFGMTADQIFVSRATGLEPDEVYAHCSWARRLRPPVLTEVSMPTWLKKRANRDGEKLYALTRLADAEKAKFILEAQLRRLRKVLRKSYASGQSDSTWSGYYGCPASQNRRIALLRRPQHRRDR